MKFRVSWLWVCVLALALLVTACGKSSDPYDNFKGTWIIQEKESDSYIASFSLEPERKMLTMTMPRVFIINDIRKEVFFLLEIPVTDMQTRDGSLAIGLDNSVLLAANEMIHAGSFLQFQSLVFEPLNDDSILLKMYGSDHSAESLLGKNAPKPKNLVEIVHPNGTQKKILADIGSSSLTKLQDEWYLEDDDEKPAMSFDEKTGTFKLRNTKLIAELGDSTFTPLGYFEKIEPDSRVGFLLFKEGNRENNLAVLLSASPFEGELKIERGYFTVLPKLSSSEKQKRAEAKQEERRQAAQKELEDQRKREEEARLAKEKAEAEAQRLREEEEARQKALAEKRASIPEFSFNDIRLSDSPQQMVEKGLARYKMSTSFPVQQKDNTIGTVKNPSLGAICFLLEDPLLEEFFGRERQRLTVGSRYYQLGSETTAGYLMGPSELAAKAGLRSDVLIFADKTRKDPTSTQMQIAFFTLPDGSPRPLYLEVNGDIVLDAVSVFQDRYGDQENVTKTRDEHSTQYIWRSDKEIAILRADRQDDRSYQHHLLYIVSLPAYEELTAFEQKLEQQQEAAQKAAEEAKQAEEKARQDARKAGI